MKPKISAFALCLLASSAEAKDEATRLDVRPDWLKRPDAADVLAVWPSAAWIKGLGGRAVISCRVTLQGALADCSVNREEPVGAGFGAAAIALSPQFLMKPGIRDGKPVEHDRGFAGADGGGIEPVAHAHHRLVDLLGRL